MKSIVVVTEKPLDLDMLAVVYKTSGKPTLQSTDRLVVEGGWGWFAFNRENALEEEFDESELDKLRQQMPSLAFAQLEFGDSRAADVAILGLAVNDNIIIDNDQGLITPIGEVQRRIRQGEDWLSATS